VLLVMRKNETEQRITALRSYFNKWRVDAVYISSETNRRWLSGFTGSNGQLLITREHTMLATDFRYWEQVQQQAPDFTLFKHQRTAVDTARLFTEVGVRRVGVEANHLTLQMDADLKNNETLSNIIWVPLPQTVEQLRAVKNSAEIAAIRAAAGITDHTMNQVNHLACPGMSEKTLAWELEKIMRDAGAETTAFTIIVASGPNSALPHHHPGDRLLQAGDVLVVDMGAQLDGYKSDLTRTFYLGEEPDEQFWAVYNVVLAAQTAVLQQVRPGTTAKEADAIARDIITAAGYEKHFGHGLGHGLGLDIHEAPFLSPRDENTILLPNMITTVEPGIYLPGWGGVRIEDLTYCTEEGLIPLSRCPKTPVISIKK